MISVIIPAHNEEKYLAATVKSIRQGLTVPHEIIVAEGGSTDATVSIAQTCADIVASYPTPDQNISKNRNNGARHSHGDILVFIDSGVRLVDPDAFFKRALAHFEDSRVVALAVSYKAFPETERLSDKIIYGFFNFTYFIMNNYLHMGAAVGKFQMIRRDAFFSLGGYREDLVTMEDNNMFVRLAKIGRTVFDRSLVVYHENRRARAIGWPRLLGIWTLNSLSFAAQNKSFSADWKQAEQKTKN